MNREPDGVRWKVYGLMMSLNLHLSLLSQLPVNYSDYSDHDSICKRRFLIRIVGLARSSTSIDSFVGKVKFCNIYY